MDDVPASPHPRGVEPAGVVPAGDVRGPEEDLPGRFAEPDPDIGVDVAAERSQHPGELDDRRFDHRRAFVEVRAHQDRLQDRADLPARAAVGVDQSVLHRRRGRLRHEVAPELGDEEGRVKGVLDAEPAGVFPAPVAGSAKDRLVVVVVAFGVEAEVVGAEFSGPVVAPTGQRPCLFADVVLAVGATVGAEAEQLHHLPPVVLVWRPLAVFGPVQPLQHRRVDRHRLEEVEEGAEAVGAEEIGLVDHLLLFGDAVDRGREPVVEDQRHPLDQRLVGSDHAVEPPEVAVAPDVGGGDRVSFVVGRRRPAEGGAAAGPGQRLDRTDQAQ